GGRGKNDNSVPGGNPGKREDWHIFLKSHRINMRAKARAPQKRKGLRSGAPAGGAYDTERFCRDAPRADPLRMDWSWEAPPASAPDAPLLDRISLCHADPRTKVSGHRHGHPGLRRFIYT